MAQTRDLALAQQRLALLPELEGVVAKKSDGHYAPGRRDWVKVKRQRTVDCVVIGLAGDAVNPALVLGLRHADGVLHHLGRLSGVSSLILSGRTECRFRRSNVASAVTARESSAAFLRRGAAFRLDTPPDWLRGC